MMMFLETQRDLYHFLVRNAPIYLIYHLRQLFVSIQLIASHFEIKNYPRFGSKINLLPNLRGVLQIMENHEMVCFFKCFSLKHHFIKHFSPPLSKIHLSRYKIFTEKKFKSHYQPKILKRWKNGMGTFYDLGWGRCLI